MMRRRSVIFDTNVVIAGLRLPREGGPRLSLTVLRHWWSSRLGGVVGPPLLAEYAAVIERHRDDVWSESHGALLAAVGDPQRTTHVTVDGPPFPRRSQDPDDDHIFALAEAAGPDFICSKDRPGLLDAVMVGDARVVTPKELESIAAMQQLLDGAVRQSTRG